MTWTSTVWMQRWKWTSIAGGRVPKNGGYQDGEKFTAEQICGMATYLLTKDWVWTTVSFGYLIISAYRTPYQ